jgi:NADH:ubiquinone oxidoreductase subunit C
MVIRSKNTKQQLVIHRILQQSLAVVRRSAPAFVFKTTARFNQPCFRTTPAKLRPLAIFLRNNELFQATTLLDIQTVDKLEVEGRFAVKYQLLSTKLNQRYLIELNVDEITPIPSLAAPVLNNHRVFASAG